jgi:hypothetical protein
MLKGKKAKAFGNIGESNIMIKKGKVPNSKSISTLLIPEITLQNIKLSPDNADPIDYDDFKQFVESNKFTLFKTGKSYKINVLTDGGWRSSSKNYGVFIGENYDGESDFYNPEREYNEAREDSIKWVYAVQILRLN